MAQAQGHSLIMRPDGECTGDSYVPILDIASDELQPELGACHRLANVGIRFSYRHQCKHSRGGAYRRPPGLVPPYTWLAGETSMRPPSASGQPPTLRTCPSWATSLAGIPATASHSSARSPATIAAVAAALASAQVAAATLTVCQGPSAGSPVRGSTMWCNPCPARRHWRQVIDEVATAPPASRTVCVRDEPCSSGLSATRIGRPPSGASRAMALSPPRLTSTPPV